MGSSVAEKLATEILSPVCELHSGAVVEPT